MTKIVEDFRIRLEKALTKNNMKPIELAEKTGISQSTISQYRSGYSKPKDKRLVKIAEVLHVNPAWLMGLDVPEEPQENLAGGISYHQNGYYINDETALVAQEIFENKELRALFDVQRDMDPDDLRALHNMALALKRKERYNGDDPA